MLTTNFEAYFTYLINNRFVQNMKLLKRTLCQLIMRRLGLLRLWTSIILYKLNSYATSMFEMRLLQILINLLQTLGGHIVDIVLIIIEFTRNFISRGSLKSQAKQDFHPHHQKEFFHHGIFIIMKYLIRYWITLDILKRKMLKWILRKPMHLYSIIVQIMQSHLLNTRVEGAGMDSFISQAQDQLKHAADYLKGKKITTNVAIYNTYDSQEF